MATLKMKDIRLDVPIPNATMVVEMKVVPAYKFHIRLWLGKQLFRAAAWVLGCNIRFDGGSSDE